MLLSRAETLYTQCRFAEALELTTAILNPASDSMSASAADTTSSSLNIMTQGAQAHTLGHSPAVYPLHLACLYETGATNSLFLLAHTLIDNAPDESYAYLAIGIYYMAVSKIAEARRYFSKASLLDPHSAPAWIGFAHTFAAEGEHDQAIAAYSTAARLFQGSHLPQLFLGMQHLALNNLSLAHEYLRSAYAKSCAAAGGAGDTVRPELGTADDEDGGGGSGGSGGGGVGDAATARPPLRGGDPLVLNELGIVLYHEGKLQEAVELFQQALDLAAQLHCERGAWLATRANLGHALRRLWRFDEALEQFDECLRISSSAPSLMSAPLSASMSASMSMPAAVSAAAAGGGTSGAGALISVGAATATGSARLEDRGLVGSLHTAKGLVLLELGRTTEAVTTLHEAVRVLGPTGSDTAAGAGVAAALLGKALEVWDMEQLDASIAEAQAATYARTLQRDAASTTALFQTPSPPPPPQPAPARGPSKTVKGKGRSKGVSATVSASASASASCSHRAPHASRATAASRARMRDREREREREVEAAMSAVDLDLDTNPNTNPNADDNASAHRGATAQQTVQQELDREADSVLGRALARTARRARAAPPRRSQSRRVAR